MNPCLLYTSIEEVQNAGIQVVMITGDRLETAIAIAKDAGLLKNSTCLLYTSSTINLSGSSIGWVRTRFRRFYMKVKSVIMN